MFDNDPSPQSLCAEWIMLLERELYKINADKEENQEYIFLLKQWIRDAIIRFDNLVKVSLKQS